jgi:hypothetical protein
MIKATFYVLMDHKIEKNDESPNNQITGLTE